jgi:2-keto-3-deoxy-L-rhamnonate aldolase RhmA
MRRESGSKKGEMSLGVGIRTARTVDIAKMMKTAGYDWLFIDLEYRPMAIDFAATIAVAAPPCSRRWSLLRLMEFD